MKHIRHKKTSVLIELLKSYKNTRNGADVAELADALDLGSSVFDVGVQVPSSAPLRVFL